MKLYFQKKGCLWLNLDCTEQNEQASHVERAGEDQFPAVLPVPHHSLPQLVPRAHAQGAGADPEDDGEYGLCPGGS